MVLCTCMEQPCWLQAFTIEAYFMDTEPQLSTWLFSFPKHSKVSHTKVALLLANPCWCLFPALLLGRLLGVP